VEYQTISETEFEQKLNNKILLNISKNYYAITTLYTLLTSSLVVMLHAVRYVCETQRVQILTTTHHSLTTPHYSLPTTPYSIPTTHYPLLTTQL